MGFKCGIVGLPNVGKSTLFNALTETASAEAANYPFCTIEPNTGIVSVPDKRLVELSDLAKSQKIIPAQMQFVDIAGLVSGASKGEGLGNKFLSHIREVDAIIHVLRCFEDPDITHVENNINPLRDAEIIETELMLADIESLDRQIQNLTKKAKTNDQDAKSDLLLKRGMDAMSKGDYNASIEHLTAAIDYTPEFAEAWNMRATVFFLMDNYNQSVSDIQQTLKLNPRHFGALSGLGMIFERSGQPKQALEVYKKLLEVHPRSINAIMSVDRLIKYLEGTSL